MINLQAYPQFKEAQDGQASVLVSDLVAIGNCRRSGDIISTVVSDDNAYITINGVFSTSYIGRYALAGREVLKITNIVPLATTTKIYVDRAQFGTINSYENRLLYDCAIEMNFNFRTVEFFNSANSFDVSGNGGNMSELFSFQVESGKVDIDVENLEDFNDSNPNSKYKFNPKTSTIHIFKGFNGSRILKYTGFFDKMSESYGRSERSATISFYDKWGLIYNSKITDSFVFENVKPLEMIATILKIPQSMVYYSSGLTDADFYYIKSVYSKEYSAYKDFFGALVQHGIRLCYDELERVKIFSDLKATQVVADLEFAINETNILDVKKSTDSKFIRNKLTSTFKKRQTLYDYTGTLDSKHVYFRYNVAVSNFTFLKGNEEYTPLDVADTLLFTSTKIGDLVLLKDNILGNQFYGKVMDKQLPNITQILVGQFSKDSYLTPIGKYTYLNSLGFSSPRNFTLHFSVERLPEVANIVVDYVSGEKSQKLRYPLLPQITGQPEVLKSWDITFGSVADLQVGKYAGITSNVEGIYGTWDNTKLLYDRELDQFNSINPPISVLTNRVTTALGNGNGTLLQYNTFDNSNLQLTVATSTDSESDIKVDFKNTTTIPSSQVVTLTPLARTLNNTLKVSTLTGINIGDVLVVQPNLNMSVIDNDTYQKVKDIRYTIIGCLTEGADKYITLSDNYPLADGGAFVFKASKYPYNSIVFLQEMYMRGNPVIEEEIPINIINQESIDVYGEIPYSFDARFYDENGYKDLLDYFHKGYGAISTSDKKYVYPIKVRDHWQVSKGDIIRLQDRIYTGIETTSLWYVLSVSYRSKNQEIGLNVININNFDADGSWIKFDSALNYQPSSEVFYEYNEADTGKNVLNEEDDVFGKISATKIPRDVFKANILSYVNGILTFDGFSGSDVTNKRAMLFSPTNKQNFVVQVGGEYLYVKATSDSACLILKRNMFKSPTAQLDSTQTITFYYITSVVNPEGTLISQDLYVGNETNCMKFDSDTGKTDIISTGEINISNQNNRFYFDPATVNNKSQILLNVPSGSWSDSSKFQIGSAGGALLKYYYDVDQYKLRFEGGSNYINFTSTGMSLKGIIDLDTSSSYIRFDSGYTMQSWNDVGSEGFSVANSGGNVMQFGFSDNYKGIFSGWVYNTGTYNNAFLINSNDSVGYNYADILYTSNGYTQPIHINGLTVGGQAHTPVNGSIRLSSGMLQCYYGSAWISICNLAFTNEQNFRFSGDTLQVYHNSTWVTVATL